MILNGKDLGTLWMSPFKTNISSALKKGDNTLEIEVTNLWINRLIGDDRFAHYGENSGNYLGKTFPNWLSLGQPPPTNVPLRTLSVFKHWKATDKLVSSGLIGPVIIEAAY